MTYSGISHLETPIVQPAKLPRIAEMTSAAGFDMASEPRTGALLRVLAATKPAGRFLELGTGSGMGAAWLLDGMDGASVLFSVDSDPRVQAIAKETLGADGRLHLIEADGEDYLRSLEPGSFDFIFADAIPGKYTAVKETIELLKPGGIYLIDDMTPQADWPEDHFPAVHAALGGLLVLEDVHVVAMNWATGIMLFVKRAPASGSRADCI